MRAPYKILPGGRAILCLVCGKTSFNPNDVKQLFCACCNVFHEDGENEDFEATTSRALDLFLANKHRPSALNWARAFAIAAEEGDPAPERAVLGAALKRLQEAQQTGEKPAPPAS
jgi:hypothetical protein